MTESNNLHKWIRQNNSLIQGMALVHACRMPGPIGMIARQTIQAQLDREQWSLCCQMLGADEKELEQHEGIVRQLAITSPLFSNQTVWAVGWKLAQDRLRRGLPLLPDNPAAWADELWKETYFYDPDQVHRSLDILRVPMMSNEGRYYIDSLREYWRLEAVGLWQAVQGADAGGV